MDQGNAAIAGRLDEVAVLLEDQGANPYKVAAYRKAATILRRLAQPVSESIDGLIKLPWIGDSIARSIHTLITTGNLPMLARLRGETDPAPLLATVPGIGKELARKLHEDLGIETLEDLEAAAHDGRLSKLKGFGKKRISGIRESLASRLGRVGRGAVSVVPPPTVGEILDVDHEYRQKSREHSLPRIRPRRFNPDCKDWLPVLHRVRQGRHYTALFSNTARAHDLGRTGDWVVIYYDGDRREHQCTVVTGHWGRLKDKRLIRGREAECELYYSRQESAARYQKRKDAASDRATGADQNARRGRLPAQAIASLPSPYRAS